MNRITLSFRSSSDSKLDLSSFRDRMLNQIEIWFSILSRKLLRRSSFESLEDLEERVMRFIDYFNETMAKPMKWLYSPRPRYEEADTD